MTAPLPNTELGRAALRAKGGAAWLPLSDYIHAVGCSRRTVFRRNDIQTCLIDGQVFVARSALDVKIRGGAK